MRILWRWEVCDRCKGTGDCCSGACGLIGDSPFTCMDCNGHGGAWVGRWPWVERKLRPPATVRVGPKWWRDQMANARARS